MNSDLKEIYSELTGLVGSSCVAKLDRAVRREKASTHINAIMAHHEPTIEILADAIEHEMRDLLYEAVIEERFHPDNFIDDNERTIKLIARGVAVRFQNLLQEETECQNQLFKNT